MQLNLRHVMFLKCQLMLQMLGPLLPDEGEENEADEHCKHLRDIKRRGKDPAARRPRLQKRENG